MQILNRLILPKEINNCNQMYFRGKHISLKENQLEVAKNGKVTFDTYFNLFEHTLFQEKTDIKNIDFNFELQGEATITIYHSYVNQEWYDKLWLKDNKTNCEHKIKKTKLIVVQKNTQIREFVCLPINLTKIPNKGFCYAEIKSKKGCIIYSGQIITDVAPKNNIKLAITMCTFKREEYAIKNAHLVVDCIEKNNLQNSIHLYIIDNGQTLHQIDGATILPNKNLGGSGGFTRGMIQSLQDECTHCLLMDDDISLEPEVILRTYVILINVNAVDRTIIGASIIKLNTFVQWARNEYLDKEKCFIKRTQPLNLDLDKVGNLYINSFKYKYKNKYLAWPYACFPTSCFKRHGFSLPFFIKWDDIELGLRQKEYDFLYSNGIGVWHEDFLAKYNPALGFYWHKNMIITNFFHMRENLNAIKNLMKSVINHTSNLQRYDEAESILQCYEDMLTGSSHLLTENGNFLLTARDKFNFKNYTKLELLALGYDIDALQEGKVKNANLLNFITSPPESYSKSLPNIQYNFETNMGFITMYDAKREKDLKDRLQNVISLLVKKYPYIQQEYKEAYLNLISANSWEKLLDLPRQEKAHFKREMFINVAYYVNSKQDYLKLLEQFENLYNARVQPIIITERQDLYKLLQTTNYQSFLLHKTELEKTIKCTKILYENDIQIVHDLSNHSSFLHPICKTVCRPLVTQPILDTTSLLAEYDKCIKELPKTKKVVAVLLVEESTKNIDKALQMLAKQNYTDFSTIIIDNSNSKNLSIDITQERMKDVAYHILYKSCTQAYFYKYALQIARYSGAEWIYLLNEHVVLQEDSLQKLVAATFDKEEKISFVSSNIQTTEQVAQDRYGFKIEKGELGEISSTSFSSVLINNRAIALYGLPLKIFQEAFSDREFLLRISAAFGNGIVVQDDIVYLNPPTLCEEKQIYEWSNRLFLARAYFGKEAFKAEKKRFIEIGKKDKTRAKNIKKAIKLLNTISVKVFNHRYDLNLDEDNIQSSKLKNFKDLIPKAYAVLRRDGLKIFISRTIYFLKNRDKSLSEKSKFVVISNYTI